MVFAEGWVEASLESLVGIGGYATDGDWIESKDQDPSGSIRLIQLMDIGDGEFRNRSKRFLTAETAERLRCTLLKPGDVLIARMPDPIGRACVFPGVGQDAATAVDVMIWHPGQHAVDAAWLASAINSSSFRARIEASASGTTRQRIAGGALKKMSLPVPPVAEQRRIVAKIDRLSARSKRARDEFKPVSSLLEKYQSAVLAREFEEFSTAQATLSEYVEDGLIGLVRSKDEQSDEQGVPYIRMQHFDLFGAWSSAYRTRVQVSESEARRYGLEIGDVLFNTRNSSELVGKVAIWPGSDVLHVYNNNLLRLRFKKGLNPHFAYLQMRCPQFRARLESLKSATTSVAAIYQKPLYQLPFWRPRVTVQAAIVRRIERAFAAIDRLAAEAQSARALLDKLDQAILAKAFRGELVPQDPSDEPASVLLERIRAERAAAPIRRSRRKIEETL